MLVFVANGAIFTSRHLIDTATRSGGVDFSLFDRVTTRERNREAVARSIAAALGDPPRRPAEAAP